MVAAFQSFTTQAETHTSLDVLGISRTYQFGFHSKVKNVAKLVIFSNVWRIDNKSKPLLE